MSYFTSAFNHNPYIIFKPKTVCMSESASQACKQRQIMHIMHSVGNSLIQQNHMFRNLMMLPKR